MELCLLLLEDWNSSFTLHSDAYYIFYYQGGSATGDLYDNFVLRFAHTDIEGTARGDQFRVVTDGYDRAPFEYSVETNTPFPYHAELHINRTRFDYEGEYIIIYNYRYQLQPKFTIDVNGKFLRLLTFVCQMIAQTRCIIT